MQMSNQNVLEHRIKKEVSNSKFGYQLASIFFIFVLIRFFLFREINYLDHFLIFLSILFIIFSKFKPIFINPIKKFWIRFSLLLAKILNPILLFIIYLVCFIPIGIFYKILKKENLKTKLDKNLISYWEVPDDTEIDFDEQF